MFTTKNAKKDEELVHHEEHEVHEERRGCFCFPAGPRNRNVSSRFTTSVFLTLLFILYASF